MSAVLPRENEQTSLLLDGYTWEQYLREDKEWPDLAVEGALTSGGLSKRKFYATFPVPELWIWRKDNLEVHVFDATKGEYDLSESSTQLPGIDIAWLVECSKIHITSEAIKSFRSKI